jgi:hypothetical protein
MVTYKGHTYTNGNVPKVLLAPLDGQNYGNAELRRDAAESWNRARAEVKAKTGIVLTVRGWNRTLAEQERFFFERYSRQAAGNGPFGDVRWYKGVRYVRTTGAPAAIPGTSNHGWGLAVDIDDFGAYRTKGNARSRLASPILEKHGWTDDEGSSIGEPWHRVYKPERDTHPAPIKTTPQEEPMTDGLNTEQATQLSTVHGVLTRKLTDGSGATTPDQIWQRTLDVSRRTLVAVQANNAALTVAMETLAKNVGVDPEVVTAAVEKAVREALPESITIPLEDQP